MAHGLPLDGNMYPSTFLPRGFAFCGATVDGTVTLWDVKEGDRLQSVQHLRASMSLMFPFIGTHPSEAGATLHAVTVRFAATIHALPPLPHEPIPLLAGLHRREEWRRAPCNGIS